MITGVIRIEESTQESRGVYWVIDDAERRLVEEGILFSDVFDFGGQQWRVLLHSVELLDARYIQVSLSRVTMGNIPWISRSSRHFPSVLWHAGILDKDEFWQYDRKGSVVLMTSKRWTTVSDWCGPEWTYMCEEKDLYMPDDRLTLAVQLWWTAICKENDPKGSKMNTIENRLKTKDYDHFTKKVFWMIDDPQRLFEDCKTFLSDAFSFGDQKWRVLLQAVEILDALYIDISLSRITASSKTPLFPFVDWRAGILDRHGAWHYDRNGLTRLEETGEWITVEDWSGPEWSFMSSAKNLYMPEDRLTVAVKLSWYNNCTWMDPEGRKTKTIAGTLATQKDKEHLKEVLWTIEKPEERLKYSDFLLSGTFYFGRHSWRLSVHCGDPKDASRIYIGLSSAATFNETPIFPSVWWHVGILDRDEVYHYDRSGWAKLQTPRGEWRQVTEWPGPDRAHLSQKKDPSKPNDQLKVSLTVSIFGPEDLPTVGELPHLTKLNPGAMVPTCSSPMEKYMPGEECDVTVRVAYRTFRVHRTMLEIFCPVMAAMLYPDVVRGEWLLHLADCDPRAFEIFLSFMYSGTFDALTDQTVRQVYYIADKYDVTELREECVRKLLTTLTVDSVCGVLELADSHGDAEMRDQAAEFLVTNARDVFRTASWLQFMGTHTKLASDLIIRSHEKAN